jgi:hypothetical protein
MLIDAKDLTEAELEEAVKEAMHKFDHVWDGAAWQLVPKEDVTAEFSRHLDEHHGGNREDCPVFCELR